MSEKIEIYDVTPRDGDQSHGINLTKDDKLWFVRKDDEIGIDCIEVGYPLSNRTDKEIFDELKRNPPTKTQYAAFGMTIKKYGSTTEDKGMQALAKCEAPWITIVGKSSRFHVEEILDIDIEENRRIIFESLAFIKRTINPKRLIYDAEHFFDAFKKDKKHAMQTLESAVKGGADTLVLCDTNGGNFPSFISKTVATVVNEFRDQIIGIHCHNDANLAEANTHMAVESGAQHVQGTWNGLGERTGNADLFSVIPNLKRAGYQVPETKHFTSFSREVAQITKQNIIANRSFVGQRAFTHKGGMHVSAVNKNPSAYEFMDPSEVGNQRIISGSKQAGRSNVRRITIDSSAISTDIKNLILTDTSLQDRILQAIEDFDNNGGLIELAPATLELLILKSIDKFTPKIIELKKPYIYDELGGPTEATIKIKINGNEDTIHVVSEGDGPLGALANALLKAMQNKYPILNKLKLVDYYSKKLPSEKGTGSLIQVIAEFTDGKNTWSTTGISDDSTLAGWISVKDAIEYMLLKNGHVK